MNQDDGIDDCPTKGDECICGERGCGMDDLEKGCEVCGPGVVHDLIFGEDEGSEEEDEGPSMHDIGFGDISALQQRLRPDAEEYDFPFGARNVICAGAGRIRVTLLTGTAKLHVQNSSGYVDASLVINMPILVGDLAVLRTEEQDDEDENEEAAARVRIEFLD